MSLCTPTRVSYDGKSVDYGSVEGVQATFDWQAARDSTLGRMCTATLINEVESS